MTNSQTNCKPIITHHPPRVASTSSFSPQKSPCLSFGWSWVQHHLHPPKLHQKADGQTWVSLPDHLRRAKGFVLPKGWKVKKLHESAEFSAMYIYTFTGLKGPWIYIYIYVCVCDDICLLTRNHYGHTCNKRNVASPPLIQACFPT